MPRPTNFTRLERRFIGFMCGLEGYGNAGQYRPARAAHLAGYSPKRVNQAAYKLTHRPRVKAAIEAYFDLEYERNKQAHQQRRAREAAVWYPGGVRAG